MLPGMDMGLVALTLTLWVLSVARIIRAINYDTLFDPIRLRIAHRIHAGQATLPDTPPSRALKAWITWQQFLGCPWCVGFWVSAATAPAVIIILDWSWWMFPILTLTGSHLIGASDRLVADPLTIVNDE